MKNIKKRLKYRINRVLRVILYISLFTFSSIMLTFLIISQTLDLEIPKIQTIKIYDSDNNLILSYSNGKRKSYISLDKVPSHTIDAFLSIEDKRFFDHDGLDFIRIIKATMVDIMHKGLKEGASTITQQYARNLFLTNDKTWKRKLSEMMIALNLEQTYSKEEILEGYLNSIYFDHGIYGIEDASLFYFNKHASELTILESCTLSAIPKGPSIYSPLKNYEKNKERRNIILKELLEDNKIDLLNYQTLINEDTLIYGKNNFTIEEKAPYFQDYCLEELSKLANFEDYLYKGINVYTTLNSDYQKKLCNIIENEEINQEISLVAIEPKSGEIKAMIGGKNYLSSSFNRATKAKRQIASTVKPLLYLGAIENGFNVATTFKSEETVFYIGNKPYSPHNFSNIYPNTDVSLIYALACSDNIYAMKTHLYLGMTSLKNTLLRLGLTKNIEIVPSSALGTFELSNLELSSLYQPLANEGIKIEPFGIKYITKLDGTEIYKHIPKHQEVINKSDCFILNEAMTHIFNPNITINIRPTGSAIANLLRVKTCAKSGSTDYDHWMIGYNKDILVSVWSGSDDNIKITKTQDKIVSKYIYAKAINAYFENKNTTWYEIPNDVIGLNINPTTGFYSNFNEYQTTCYFKKSNIPWYLNLLEGFIY